MNKTLENFARQKVLEGIKALPDKTYPPFKRMYSPKALDSPIEHIVRDMKAEDLDWALTQIERTQANLTEALRN